MAIDFAELYQEILKEMGLWAPTGGPIAGRPVGAEALQRFNEVWREYAPAFGTVRPEGFTPNPDEERQAAKAILAELQKRVGSVMAMFSAEKNPAEVVTGMSKLMEDYFVSNGICFSKGDVLVQPIRTIYDHEFELGKTLRMLNSLSRLLHKYPEGEDRGYVDTAVAIFGGRLVIAANNRDDTSFRAEILERIRLLQRYFVDTDTEADENFVIQRILPATMEYAKRAVLVVRLTTDLRKVKARLPREFLAEARIALTSKAFRDASGIQVHAEMDIMAYILHSGAVPATRQSILVGNTQLACFHCDRKLQEHNRSAHPYNANSV